MVAVVAARSGSGILRDPPSAIARAYDAILCGSGGSLSCCFALTYGHTDSSVIMPVCGAYGFLGLIQFRAACIHFVRIIIGRYLRIDLKEEDSHVGENNERR